jgi:hypothetical protein
MNIPNRYLIIPYLAGLGDYNAHLTAGERRDDVRLRYVLTSRREILSSYKIKGDKSGRI